MSKIFLVVFLLLLFCGPCAAADATPKQSRTNYDWSALVGDNTGTYGPPGECKVWYFKDKSEIEGYIKNPKEMRIYVRTMNLMFGSLDKCHRALK